VYFRKTEQNGSCWHLSGPGKFTFLISDICHFVPDIFHFYLIFLILDLIFVILTHTNSVQSIFTLQVSTWPSSTKLAARPGLQSSFIG